ncbi:MAG: hypothetical protein JW942_06645 [Opitutales bacterium]|nr:hypothetical protein [Opitutales bacterium]
MLKETNYRGWKALEISTDQAELIIPTGIGPRVISCRLKDGENLFTGIEEHMGGSGEKEFTVRGGHRLWHAPEHPERTYGPDNAPVEVTLLDSGRGVVLTQDVEPTTGIQKQMAVEVINSTSFKVSHRLTNLNLWAVELAPWALSMMRNDGYAVVPYPPKKSHSESLLPNMAIVPWTYTDLSLPIWKLRSDYLGIDVSKADRSQKIGITFFPGWSAYWTPQGTFVKYYQVVPGAKYPDLGSCFEAYTCDWMIELESLAPLAKLAPQGGFAEHVEYWGLIKGLPKPDSDAVFHDKFRPVIENWLSCTRI